MSSRNTSSTMNMPTQKAITPASFRFAIQLVFTLFCVYVGIEFTRFLAWVTDASTQAVAKPGAVEGFLPISALLGFRQWIATGQWDAVHPAGLTIFLAVLTMAVLFRKGFCGYICPIGFVSNLLERAGRRMGMAFIPPKWIDYPLMCVKYGLTGFFLYTVFFSMDLRSVQSFIRGPYNMVSDAKMLAFFTDPTALSLMILGTLAALSLVVRNFWCRYLCPYGALLGVIAWFGPTTIVRDSDTCVDCGQCAKGCPSGIRVDQKHIVRSPECIGCGECIGNCPVDGCLVFSIYGKTRIPWLMVGIGAIATLLAAWWWAVATGHWESPMPSFMLKKIYASFLTKA